MKTTLKNLKSVHMYANPLNKQAIQQLKRFITRNTHITQVYLCMNKIILKSAVELTGPITSLKELTINDMHESGINTKNIKSLIQIHPSITVLDLQACYLTIEQIELITQKLKNLELLKHFIVSIRGQISGIRQNDFSKRTSTIII